MLVTTDQVNQYEKSEHCILAVVYCILCKIHFQSAHRSGIMTNMTIDEFRAMEKGDDNMLRIEVTDHKTDDTYGSGKLMLYPFEYE